MIKRSLAVLLLALTIVPATGSAALASGHKEKVACFFYQTFAERDPWDCVI